VLTPPAHPLSTLTRNCFEGGRRRAAMTMLLKQSALCGGEMLQQLLPWKPLGLCSAAERHARLPMCLERRLLPPPLYISIQLSTSCTEGRGLTWGQLATHYAITREGTWRMLGCQVLCSKCSTTHFMHMAVRRRRMGRRLVAQRYLVRFLTTLASV
jgi:hypothetical protein